MSKRRVLVSLSLCLSAGLPVHAAWSAEPLIGNGGFETGLTAPWGTGQYAEGRPIWWNSHDCQSAAEIDETTAMEGFVSLHLVNRSRRAPQVYGTTVQRIRIQPNQPYRITVWAQGLDLAAAGSVALIVDDAWTVRPIALPGGTYAWTKLSGVFSLPVDYANIRILFEDTGEVWLDDLQITPLDSALRFDR